jgi:hypothetical protein
MNRGNYNFILTIFFILIVSATVSADNLEIKAYTNKTVVGLNQQFDLQVEISGEDYQKAGSPQLPDMDNFFHFLGSSTSQNIQYINGKMSASKTITFHYLASVIGTFTIEAITVKAGNKEYQTTPIEITVVKASQQSATQGKRQQTSPSQTSGSLDDELFLLAIPDKKTVYKNEAVTLTYKIFTRVDVSSFGLEKSPSYKGFLKEEFDIGRHPQTTNEVYKNKQYTVAEIQKISLYPLSTESKKIDPLIINCQVRMRRKSRDIFDDFFSDPFGRNINKIISSNPVTLMVLPLPEQGKPQGFTGVVGDFTLNSKVDKTNLTTDEAVTFTVKISGEGHIGSLSEPELNFPDNFETYDPEVSKQVNRKGGRITGSKIFTYVLVPRKTGTCRIESITYPIFNPKTKKYQILSTDPVKIHISKGKNIATSVAHSGFSKEEVDLIGKDIRFIKEDYDSLKKVGWNVFFSWLFWVFFLFPLVILVTALAYKKHLDRLHTDQAYARNRTARRVAKKHLSEARAAISLSEQKTFYAAVNRALSGFISDKFNISGAGMMSEDVKKRLKQREVSDSLIEQYNEILQTCDLKRFAPSEATSEEKKEFYRKVEQVLSDLAKELS